jgi:2-amino-4-hydroxy-6-hydroxymethyldihydropteridine diphosphokinase
MRSGIFLLLGSNLHLPEQNLSGAKNFLEKRAGKIVKASSVYRTAPWGVSDQPDFYNQTVQIETSLEPEQLLDQILSIEAEMGRAREKKWGPRIIDIDILLYDQIIINSSTLKIPHPGIPDRRFTLLPLSEIAAEVIHPALNTSIGELLKACRDELPVHRISGPETKG